MIYLDNASSTKVLKEVYDEMNKYFIENYANPGVQHYDLALKANEAVKTAEERIKKAFNCHDYKVIFNSGSTEGNNHVLKGISSISKGKHIITSNAEHASVKKVLQYLETIGYEVTYLPINSNGVINIQDLKDNIRKDTALVSIMMVNNELGSITDLKSIDNICYENNILIHTDATQGVGKVRINMSEYKAIKFLTYSSHKIYGPKGVGVLLVGTDQDNIPLKLQPLMHGAGHQDGYRAGTLNVPGIVAIGKATELASKRLDENNSKLEELEKRIISMLDIILDGRYKLNNNFENRISGVLNINVDGVLNKTLLKKVNSIFQASTGSACSITNPSETLKALGLNQKQIQESFRISASPYLDLALFDQFE